MENDQGIGSVIALEKLIELQKLESESSDLRRKVAKAPEQLEELAQKLQAAFAVVEEAESHITDSSKQRRQLEGEVEAFRGKLSHYKSQLMEVKTNEAYQAMLHEISYVEQQIVAKEDEILGQMLEADELKVNLEGAKALYAEEKERIEAERREVEAFIEKSNARLAELENAVEQVKSEVPEEFMSRYQRIARARDGVAMAVVVDHSCGACHVRLRPQLLAEIRSNRQVVLCENCSRILYFVHS